MWYHASKRKRTNLLALEKTDTFAKDHKLRWGADKCKVMPIGNHNKREKWKLGELDIGNCTNYKYLGDVISSNGKHKENIAERGWKTMAATLSIKTIASNEVLNQIETAVILELHEKINVSSLLNNAESWDLLVGEQKELEQIEVMNIKNLFDLPTRTPTPAILYSFGLPYTTSRIDKKQLLYLHRILNRDPSHWTRQTLKTLENLKIGWSKRIHTLLAKYELPDNYTTIKNIPFPLWKQHVTTALEKKHKERLYEDCHKSENGLPVPKTKTASIVKNLDTNPYIRQPQNELLSFNKLDCKTIIMSRYGMLECGKNLKGTLSSNCLTCRTVDDEEHRLNHCLRFRESNFYESGQKIPFKNLFLTDVVTLNQIVKNIAQVWNVKTAHGSMNP